MSEGDSSLGHVPAGPRWEFDETVTQVFDDMLRRSIPEYETMRGVVHDVARRFARGGFVVDLGCSRGEALARMVEEFGESCRFVGVDVSEPMLEAARERFRGLEHYVAIDRLDLREGYPDVAAACVTTAVLTLQFVPINYRQRILADACAATRSGGVFVLVEKVLGEGAGLDSLMVDVYHGLKERHGYSREEIDRKRLSLEGVLVPVTAHWNAEMLRRAGFREVDCIWRWMNFAAWAAVK